MEITLTEINGDIINIDPWKIEEIKKLPNGMTFIKYESSYKDEYIYERIIKESIGEILDTTIIGLIKKTNEDYKGNGEVE